MSQSGIEATSWESVGHSGDEGLIEGFAATKSVATNLLLIEVDLATHEPVGQSGSIGNKWPSTFTAPASLVPRR